MKRIKKLMIANGEYTNKDGQTKTRWLECGSVMEGNGKMKIKLDAVPTKQDFDGWFECFDIEPYQGNQGGRSKNIDFD